MSIVLFRYEMYLLRTYSLSTFHRVHPKTSMFLFQWQYLENDHIIICVEPFAVLNVTSFRTMYLSSVANSLSLYLLFASESLELGTLRITDDDGNYYIYFHRSVSQKFDKNILKSIIISAVNYITTVPTIFKRGGILRRFMLAKYFFPFLEYPSHSLLHSSLFFLRWLL